MSEQTQNDERSSSVSIWEAGPQGEGCAHARGGSHGPGARGNREWGGVGWRDERAHAGWNRGWDSRGAEAGGHTRSPRSGRPCPAGVFSLLWLWRPLRGLLRVGRLLGTRDPKIKPHLGPSVFHTPEVEPDNKITTSHMLNYKVLKDLDTAPASEGRD